MEKSVIDNLTKMPLQPIRNGRFVPNRIVKTLLDAAPIGLNELAVMEFTQSEQEQFIQLIGYSLNGFSELSYVSDETYETAFKIAEEGISELEARNVILRAKLQEIKRGLKIAVSAAFQIHPDDLNG